MTDQPDTPQPITFGPTRAIVTLFDYNPPAVVFLDVNNNAVATAGMPDHLFESIRVGLATAIGPRSTPAPTEGLKRHPSEEEMDEGYRRLAEDMERERGKSQGKGKGKKKGHDKDKKSKKDKDKPEPVPDVIDPDALEPVTGDVDVRDDAYEPVTVTATAEVIPALFEQWYAETYGYTDNYPDPATHPELVREYLNDPKA